MVYIVVVVVEEEMIELVVEDKEEEEEIVLLVAVAMREDVAVAKVSPANDAALLDADVLPMIHDAHEIPTSYVRFLIMYATTSMKTLRPKSNERRSNQSAVSNCPTSRFDIVKRDPKF